MAITNYVGNTYCIVDSIFLEKELKFIRFDLKVYPDINKSFLMASRTFNIDMTRCCWEIMAFDLTVMPSNPVENYACTIATTNLDPSILQMYAGTKAIFKNNAWQYWSINSNELVYDSTNDVYLTYNLNTHSFVPAKDINDSRLWDKFFCTALIEEHGLINQCYAYLKSLPNFYECTDV
jgi:hypothetical protein